MKYGIYLLAFSLLHCTSLSAVSMVYNFRIAQITKQPLLEDITIRNHNVVALLFDQYQQNHQPINQNFVGGFWSYIYGFKSNYFRTDFAFANIKEHTNGITSFSDTETDDILFTAGHNFTITNNTSATISGLFGVPTHKVFRLQHVDFGTGQIGAGLQLDGTSWLRHQNALIYGARYIYFVPRHACDNVGKSHTFTIGNSVDLLFAYKHNWHKHGIEFGTTTRFQFGVHARPSLPETLLASTYIRTNFYGVYKYTFLIRDFANRILFNIAYGFDEKPKAIGNKFVITAWTAWGINF